MMTVTRNTAIRRKASIFSLFRVEWIFAEK